MKKIRILLILGSFMSSKVDATTLDPSQVLHFSISNKGMTRISVENDGIEDLYTYPTDLSENIERHNSGHVFIVGEGLRSPLNMSIITRSGVAQDLKLTPENIDPRPIILKMGSKSSKDLSEDDLSELLKSFHQGKVPEGFIPIQCQEASRSAGDIEATLEHSYQNQAYKVLIFKIQNKGEKTAVLDNRLFWSEGDKALTFDSQTVEPEKSGTMIVIQNH